MRRFMRSLHIILPMENFACKAKIEGYTVVDIMVWQMDHFKARLDVDNSGTRQNGDRMLVLNSMLYHDYKYSDVVVLRKDTFLKEPIVKRVIATAGQTVDIDFDSGTVYVEGEPLREDYINELTFLEEGTEFPLTVPEGHIFVMGDNRNNSMDSRKEIVGNIHRDDIVGRAWIRIWPLSKLGILKHQ